MKVDNTLNRRIGAIIEADNIAKSKDHVPSGKLSASRLGDPLQWQILYSLGVPQKAPDAYVLRKFLRGNHVEEWYLSSLECLERQKFVEYRGVVGYIDAVMDTKEWEFAGGIIPVEIKSVANAKFKRIDTQGADRSHRLQANLYALAMGAPEFAVSYISTDDYRILTFVFDAASHAEEINGIIDKFDEAKAKGVIPKFEPAEKWMANPDYNKYPDFSSLSEEEAQQKVASLLTKK